MSPQTTALMAHRETMTCANINCDYADAESEFDPLKYLGEPCPRCGESLLTQDGFDKIRQALTGMREHEVSKIHDLQMSDDLRKSRIETNECEQKIQAIDKKLASMTVKQ